jgi:hypothetical protein
MPTGELPPKAEDLLELLPPHIGAALPYRDKTDLLAITMTLDNPNPFGSFWFRHCCLLFVLKNDCLLGWGYSDVGSAPTNSDYYAKNSTTLDDMQQITEIFKPPLDSGI